MYYHTDAIGSVRMITGATGQLVGDRMDYLPFGEAWSGGMATQDAPAFTGAERDHETNLDYLGARFFSSGTGRFARPDDWFAGADLTNPQTWNVYAYALNNPLGYVDPTGHDVGSGKEEDPLQRWFDQWLLGKLFPGLWFQPDQRSQAGTQPTTTTCRAVPFTITGVGPGQAPFITAISRTARAQIPDGGVAIKPGNFGAAGINGRNRGIFSAIRLNADWSTSNGPRGAPALPNGLPSQGPYIPVDVVGPRKVRLAPGNMIDIYNYESRTDADASTRRVMVTAIIPRNKVGVRCPQ